MVWKVSGVTNSCAPSVIITNASAPFSSIDLLHQLPCMQQYLLTPTIIFLSFNISILHRFGLFNTGLVRL